MHRCWLPHCAALTACPGAWHIFLSAAEHSLLRTPLLADAITFDPSTNAAAGDLYLGALLGALVELPAYMLLEPLTNHFGRKPTYTVSLALSAACLLAQHLATPRASAAVDSAGHRPPVANWLAMSAALGGRFSSVAAVSVAYIVAAEIFPTSCRNSGVGWGTGCGRVGAIVAPALMLAAPSPLLLFMGLSLVAACLCQTLPESVGISLADVPQGMSSGARRRSRRQPN